jgi:predicted DNA-binding ribbon-helix-helix protein
MLINGNIKVGGHRTSIRLEPEIWAALGDIARRENLTVNQLCTEIDHGAGELSRTAAIRVFVVSYLIRLCTPASEVSAANWAIPEANVFLG